jgi:hypothetical protein
MYQFSTRFSSPHFVPDLAHTCCIHTHYLLLTLISFSSTIIILSHVAPLLVCRVTNECPLPHPTFVEFTLLPTLSELERAFQTNMICDDSILDALKPLADALLPPWRPAHWTTD